MTAGFLPLIYSPEFDVARRRHSPEWPCCKPPIGRLAFPGKSKRQNLSECSQGARGEETYYGSLRLSKKAGPSPRDAIRGAKGTLRSGWQALLADYSGPRRHPKFERSRPLLFVVGAGAGGDYGFAGAG